MRHAHPRRTAATLLSLLLPTLTLGLGACLGTTQEMTAPTAAPAEATEAPAAATPTAVSEAPAPLLEAKGAGVSLSVAGAEARSLSDGESAELGDGGVVVVGNGASARLQWGDDGASSAELLAGSSLSLQPAGEAGLISMTQDGGTVRYGAAQAAEVGATGLTVRAAEGSNFVVSLDPKAPLWVGVAQGSIELHKASPVAMAAAASAAESVTLKAGQAAAFDSNGKLLGQVDLPQAKLEAWYEGLSAGKAAPMAQLAAQKPAPAAQAVSAPAVAAPLSASFTAEATVVDAGACTNLHWSAPDALFVTLDGSDVANSGSQQVCLSEPKTFKLSWVGKDGKELSSTVGISIRSVSTDGGEEEEEVEAPPQPTPEPTECIGPECEIPLEPVEDPVLDPGDPAPAEPPPAEPAPAEPADPQPEPQPTP